MRCHFRVCRRCKCAGGGTSSAVGSSLLTGLAVDGNATFTFAVDYAVNGTAPAETFNFTATKAAVTDSSITEVNNMPDVTITDAAFESVTTGTSTTTAAATKNATVTVPAFTSVGKYYYTVKETAGTTAGTTYTDNELTLCFTVTNKDGSTTGELEASVALLKGVTINSGTVTTTGATKTDGFTVTTTGNDTDKYYNVYESGTLTVNKTVTGDLGDKSKYFKVTVTFPTQSGKSNFNTSYTVTGGSKLDGSNESSSVSYTLSDTSETTAVIYLKNGETATFSNLPAGTTYKVAEDDYSSDGYTTSYTLGGTTSTTLGTTGDTISANDEKDEVVITNNKGGETATGVLLDSLPYILIGAVVVGGLAAIFIKKRLSHKE